MAAYEYTAPRPASSQLFGEIKAAIPAAVVTGITWAGPDRLIVSLDDTLSGADKATLDALVAAHRPSLDLVKGQLVASIKKHRNYLLDHVRSIEHPDASGKRFSVSFANQHNWHGLYTARALAPYPMTIRTQDESQEHDIADATEVETLFGKVFTAVNTEITAARTAISAVMAASDEPTAQAAHDSYVGV